MIRLIPFFSFFIFSVLGQAKAIPNILAEDFVKTEYVGNWTLPLPSEPRNDSNPAYLRYKSVLENLYMWEEDEEGQTRLGRIGKDPRDALFTTTTLLDKVGEVQKSYTIGDLLYDVKAAPNADGKLEVLRGGKALGLRFIPVPETRDRHGRAVRNPKPQNYYLNPYLTKLFYNVDLPLDEQGSVNDKSLYVVVPHSNSSDFLFSTFSEMAGQKAERSTGHSSAYAYVGGLGENTRRQFLANDGLDRGTLNNLYAISVKGTSQEAVNLNLALWSKLYYDNADGYQFSDDYHFDLVTNVNLKEVLAFARGWLDRSWVRADLNNKIALKLQDPETAERFRAVLENRGEEKPQAFNPRTTTFYHLLKTNPSLALYCYEGVATTSFLGLNVPLTLKYLQRIYGAEAGQKMFDFADESWKDIQVRALGNRADPAHIISLKDPRIQDVLAQLKPLWELPRGPGKTEFSNAAEFTPTNPLYPDRDARGVPVGLDASMSAEKLAQRDKELDEVGRGLPYKPQSTTDILRAMIDIYAPFYRVGAARDTAVILTFVDKIKERTGLLFDTESPEYGFGVKAVEVLFKHEANLVWAKLNRIDTQQAITAAVLAQNPGLQGPALEAAVKVATREKYKKDYVANTNLGLDKALKVAKNPEGRLSRDEEEALRQLHYAGFKAEEIEEMLANVRRFRATRNLRLYTQIQALKEDKIATIINGVPDAPLQVDGQGYPSDGVKSYALMDSEISPILEEANDLPVKNPDIIMQTLLGEKYVKYNLPPGLIHTLAQGMHPLNPNVAFTGVATMIGESMLDPNPNKEDLHFTYLQNFFRDFAAGI